MSRPPKKAAKMPPAASPAWADASLRQVLYSGDSGSMPEQSLMSLAAPKAPANTTELRMKYRTPMIRPSMTRAPKRRPIVATWTVPRPATLM